MNPFIAVNTYGGQFYINVNNIAKVEEANPGCTIYCSDGKAVSTHTSYQVIVNAINAVFKK